MSDQEPLRLVLLEDSREDAEILVRELRRAGLDFVWQRVDTEAGLLASLDPPPDLILADYWLPDYGALGALETLQAHGGGVPLIVVSGTIGEEAAVACLRQGAIDYVLKDRLGRLGQAVRNAVAQARLHARQQHMAKELLASEERYRSLFEESPHPMWVVDAETLRFLEVNRKAVSHYGYSRQEFLALTLLEIRPPEDIASTLEGVRAVLAGEPGIGRRRHRNKAGQLLEVSVASRPVSFAGRPALLAVVDDVTERHRLEARLRQAQKMEAIGQLAGGVAHDFNNLLTTILGFAGLVAGRLRDWPHLLALVKEITKAGERGATLTGQLLAFSRRQALQPRHVDINEVVAGIEPMLRRLIGEDIELDISLQPALRPVLMDSGQLEQVIVNLAINARDAMAAGGRLVIETADVEFEASAAGALAGVQPGWHVRLAISDTGCGMDAETQAHIFEPFFTTKELGKGTGLGLATVFGIVRQSGGSIAVYSEPGHGSSFKIYLPRSTGEVSSRKEAGAVTAVPAGGSETVLVIEDDPALRSLVHLQLEGAGYTVLAGDSVAAAIALVERHRGPVHLVLTDVVLPAMNGREGAARLLVLRPEARLLYMSGYSGEAIGRRGLLPPGAELLEKPFNEKTLLRKVREVLGQARPG